MGQTGLLLQSSRKSLVDNIKLHFTDEETETQGRDVWWLQNNDHSSACAHTHLGNNLEFGKKMQTQHWSSGEREQKSLRYLVAFW